MRREDLIARGFSPEALRKFYRDFVIDAYEPGLTDGGVWLFELRGGSAATRIVMRLRSLAELDAVLLFLNRDFDQVRSVSISEQAALDRDRQVSFPTPLDKEPRLRRF
jgi:hypothetical protein